MKIKEKLMEIFENTIENGIIFDGIINKNLDYYGLFCKSASKEKLYKLLGNNLCMYKCTYEEKDSVMFIFYIPINSTETGSKTVAERVMEIVGVTENCFTTLDYIHSEEVKEDKFVYVTIIKKV